MTDKPEYRGILRNGVPFYGKHMILTATGCGSQVTSIPYMKKFLAELADEIGMVRFGPARVYRFGQGHEVGLSGIQLIETSQVSFHSNDLHRDVYLDVFSCRTFKDTVVNDFVTRKLSPAKVVDDVIWRR